MLDRRDECRSAGCARQPAAGHPQNMAHLSADCTGQPAACRNLETDPPPSAGYTGLAAGTGCLHVQDSGVNYYYY